MKWNFNSVSVFMMNRETLKSFNFVVSVLAPCPWLPRGELSFLSNSMSTLDGKFEKHWGTSCTQGLTLKSVREDHHT